MKKILIFCPENICRSQIMEAYLRFYAGNQVEVFSAGIKPGEIHPYALAVMEEDGLNLKMQYSKGIKDLPYYTFDHVITVCEDCQDQIPRKIKAKKVFHFNIPRPYIPEGASHLQLLEIFRGVRNLIQKKLLIYIGKELTESSDRKTISISSF